MVNDVGDDLLLVKASLIDSILGEIRLDDI
jgi:hypothetical protein